MRLCKADKTLCVCVCARVHARVCDEVALDHHLGQGPALHKGQALAAQDPLGSPPHPLSPPPSGCLCSSHAGSWRERWTGWRGSDTPDCCCFSAKLSPLHVPPSTSMNFPLKTHFRPTRECSVPPTNMLQTLSPASPVITLASPCKGTSLSLSRVMSLGVSLLSLATGSEDGPQEDGRQGGWAEPPWFKC